MSRMKILMLGNSYIFTNDLPKMLAELTFPLHSIRHEFASAYYSEHFKIVRLEKVKPAIRPLVFNYRRGDFR